MTTILKNALFSITVLALMFAVPACQENFDEPPGDIEDPLLPVNSTIRELKDTYTGSAFQIADETIITGIVVANDKGGNIFNQIIIDDGTAGISIALNQNELHNGFPVGRKVYIKCKGLILADDNDLLGLYGAIDITGSPVEVSSSLISKYVIKANKGYAVTPIDVADIDDLNDDFQNRLVRLSDVEFDAADANQPYADAVNKSSVSRFLEECDGDDLEVRSSGYADFASELTPKGKGTMVGIYTVYGSDKQIVLRTTDDVDMNGIKCDGSDPNAVVLFEENFNGLTGSNNSIFSLPNWQNINQDGPNKFKVAKFSSVVCVKADMFSITAGGTSTQWLITPAINLAGFSTKTLNFTSAAGFDNGAATFTALISTDYDGSSTSPQSFTWTTLPATIATGPGSGFGSFVSSGLVDLSSYSGNVYVAFKYVGTSPATTFEVDDVKVTGLP
jgi:Family of unknown function (DUF5689)/Domain of unknown function (DUF5017)